MQNYTTIIGIIDMRQRGISFDDCRNRYGVGSSTITLTHLVNRGVNIYNVRDFLGHESVATTQIYLTTNPEITRKAIESVAEKTVPESLDFFSKEDRDDLLSFLNSLG